MDLDDDGLQLLQPRNSSVSVVHWEAFASLRCEKRSLRKGPVGHSVPDSRNNSAGSFSYAAAGRGLKFLSFDPVRLRDFQVQIPSSRSAITE
jgi:hypothetical protein